MLRKQANNYKKNVEEKDKLYGKNTPTLDLNTKPKTAKGSSP